jgi:hypothetical protein
MVDGAPHFGIVFGAFLPRVGPAEAGTRAVIAPISVQVFGAVVAGRTVRIGVVARPAPRWPVTAILSGGGTLS